MQFWLRAGHLFLQFGRDVLADTFNKDMEGLELGDAVTRYLSGFNLDLFYGSLTIS